MRHLSTARRRLGAGVATLAVGLGAGVVALAGPAHADGGQAVAAESGDLAWGFKQSFRSYVGNQTAALPPIGALPYGQRITLAPPAAFDLDAAPASTSNQATPNETLPYLLPVSGGTVASADDLTVETTGAIAYHFPSHFFDITVENVGVRVSGGVASVVADVQAVVTGDFGEWHAGTYGGEDVTLAVADDADVTLSADTVSVALTGVRLTEDGAAALPLYGAGELLDDLSVSGALAPAPTAWTPSVTLSQATGLDPEATTTVTVTGSGFDPAANVGTRPPLAGKPTGVYVVFGAFPAAWRPSEGVAASARKVIDQKWVLPDPSFTEQGGQVPYVLLNPDGTFTTTLQVSAADTAEGNYGVYVYAAGGPVNAGQELYVPVTFANPGDVPIDVTVPEAEQPEEPGSFEWTISGAGAVSLGTAAQGEGAFTASGALRQVTVTDTRAGTPAWSINGRVGDFVAGERTFSGSALGWTPAVSANAGGAVAGAAVPPGVGTALTESRTLASAPAGHAPGAVAVDAGLGLRIPLTTPAGDYTGVLTLTAVG
ncbi:HtaA domain-containing protein [Xylanimonas ulmi]|uniref:Htaa protein n=1 Tax=Xylanimonas ulmi TaxID=228973 RepID=A0A4Q7M1C7_9MICO|nr:HtaA domain-containing protein [Xylanibacterium ulmi]RZS61031.1 Htaa protein [Xylanibacterium ulmi]